MCLIIASVSGVIPDVQIIRNGYSDNPHGFGACWLENGKIQSYKAFALDKMWNLIDRLQGKPYLLHFRFATHGNQDLANTHPFKITPDLWMVHNGIINIPTPRVQFSDTWHYSQRLKRDFMYDPRALSLEDRIPAISKDVGLGNKLAFLRSDGSILIANERQGDWEGEIWFSNLYSHPVWNKRDWWHDAGGESCELCGEDSEPLVDYEDYRVCLTCKWIDEAQIEIKDL